MPVTALLFALATAELDPVERRIVAAIEARQPQALALLERTVEVNSGTMNFAGVRAVGEIFAAELEELGFATRWIDGAPFERAGHLVAARPGGGARVLLIGHLDTVFEADSPFQRFELLDEDRARGPAVTDMKGGIVVMLEALRALAATDVLDDLDLRVVLTGDEEQTGRPLAAAREALREAAAGVEVALGFEDGDGDPRTAVVARRGSTSWQLRVTGLPAHSSQIFTERVGAGAVFETARILAAFYRELAVEKDLTFSPGVIVGGTEVEFDPELGSGTAFGKTNVVARRAVVAGDLRAVSPAQLDRAEATMAEILARRLPGTEAELDFAEGYPPMAAAAGNLELLALYDRVSRDLGLGPVAAVDPRRAGAADVSFVADLVPRILDGLGLMGADGHTVEETADLKTLPSQAARAALLLRRLDGSIAAGD